MGQIEAKLKGESTRLQTVCQLQLLGSPFFLTEVSAVWPPLAVSGPFHRVRSRGRRGATKFISSRFERVDTAVLCTKRRKKAVVFSDRTRGVASYGAFVKQIPG